MRLLFRTLKYGLSILALVLLVVIYWGYESDLPIAEIRQKYSGPESEFISLMGMEVHVRDQGNPNDSIPIVLIHGTSSSLHTWEPLISELGPRRRFITFDLPAFGLTGPSPENLYSFDFYNAFLDSLLNHLKLRQVVIGGNSLGGGIAWNYTVAHPARVAGLILFDATGYPRENESGSLGFKLAAMPVVGNMLLWFTPKALIRKSLQQAYSNEGLASEELVTRYHELLLMDGNRRAALSLFRNPMRPDAAKIKEIKTPTIIIFGKDDRLIDYKKAYRFGEDIAGSRVVVLENSGHVPMEENPDRVATILRDFLKPQ